MNLPEAFPESCYDEMHEVTSPKKCVKCGSAASNGAGLVGGGRICNRCVDPHDGGSSEGIMLAVSVGGAVVVLLLCVLVVRLCGLL